MNFQQLMAGECGGSNPLQQLAGHVSQDIGFQEKVGRSAIIGEIRNNQMPQTFRMDELIREANFIESPMVCGATWVTEYQEETMRRNAEIAKNQRRSKYNVQQYYRNPSHREYLNFGWPNPNRWYKPQRQQTSNEHFYQFQSVLEEPEMEFRGLSVEPDGYEYVTITDLDELDEIKEQCITQNFEQNYENDRFVQGEENIVQLESLFNDPEMFLEFINSYMRDFTAWGKNQKHYSKTELLTTTEYPFTVNNHMLIDENPAAYALAEFRRGNFAELQLCMEAAVQENPNCPKKWSWLSGSLFRSSDSYKLLFAAKQNLKFNPCDPWVNFDMANAYQLHNCHYQTCQSLVNFLKYSKEFRHLVPPNFKMEDKNTSDLSEKLLKSVMKMFINAARQNPTKPDIYIQHSLGVLCKFSRQYDRAIDCQRLVSRNVYEHTIGSHEFDLGMYLFLDNKPEEAIRVFEKIAYTKSLEVEAYIKIGFTYMYLNDYQNALAFFTKAHYLSPEDNEGVVEAWLMACNEILGSR